jgi:hypothetical protein
MVGVCPKHNVRRDKWGHCSECRKGYKEKCNSPERQRQRQEKYSNTPKGKLKQRARHYVQYAIQYGKLVRQPCVVCNNPRTDAHHAWGYSEEHLLHVIFLCREHHILADKDPAFNQKLKSDFPPSV